MKTMSNQNGRANSDRLDAMLYVLDDPALDRDEFESRLESDPALGELVAEAVALVDQLKPALRETVQIAPESKHTTAYFVLKAAWIGAIAAALLIVVSYRQVFRSVESRSSSVAQAWSDLQLTPLDQDVDDAAVSLASFLETDLSQSDESDLPDWLVLAAAKTISDSDIIQ
jgi:hypothetical protein